MTHLYYVRHAQPDYSVHDDLTRPLTEKGMRDCALVTDFLTDKSIDRVFSSPYKRAVDTVQPFAAQAHLPVTLIDDLRERRIDSVWIDDFDSFCKAQWADFDYRYKDGECLREVQERNIEALQKILLTCAGQNIVIGGHGTALSTIINFYDSAFGYEDFIRMRAKAPWIVHFTFDGTRCISIETHDLI